MPLIEMETLNLEKEIFNHQEKSLNQLLTLKDLEEQRDYILTKLEEQPISILQAKNIIDDVKMKETQLIEIENKTTKHQDMFHKNANE